MKRKVYASLLVMGLACMAVTLLISTWFFWNSTQRQIQQELEMTMNVVETTIEEGLSAFAAWYRMYYGL